MSFSSAFTAARSRIIEHVVAAWEPTKISYGSSELEPKDADLPFVFMAIGEGGAQVTNETPTINRADFTYTIGGSWAKTSGEHHEDYCLARIEELRALIDADHHLIYNSAGTVNDCQVTGIDWAIPTGIDPMAQRVHVVLTLSIQMPFER